MRTEFDYVIVGAGSAGCVMASRLSEDPSVSVCLLEAGGRDRDLRIHVPGMLGDLLGSRSSNWNYHTAPQANLDNRRLYWPRGKVLGGSSAINAMCYSRGDLGDYDDWEDAGAEGWSAMDALHWFKRSEDYSAGADQWHGAGGPLGVAKVTRGHPATEHFVMAGTQAGLRRIDDFHAGNRDGVGVFDTTTRAGRRCSAYTAYLGPSERERSNLTILSHALVRRILFDGTRAQGVDAMGGGEARLLVARREVILSAGAINTPQLLMLSGIGPADHLSACGISPVIDLPGVGENLQDHLDIALLARSAPGKTIGYSLQSMGQMALALGEYAISRRGLMTSNLAEGCGFACSREGLGKPDIQLHFLPGYSDRHGEEKFIGSNGITLHACHLYPSSRGRVRLGSADPAEHPVIDPAYLSGEGDLEALIAAAKLVAEIARQPALAGYVEKWVYPEHLDRTDDEWAALIRARAETIYHPVGTCRMGRRSDEMAVTDGSGAVRGAAGLRVVDASLMPSLIGGNTNAPVIMMAEKISAAMKEA
ncbi:GMC family oxidoreductase [Aquisalinus flavus]|nr:GMC family oxidoreductase N-terminal domain-containing protein [Aquisalinus flavus]MBD0427837.1 GMC family oxidoreductase N-terminal domain-containing protein [Aquisalinus flavus]UNE47604.1 hypothetical protein FF099_05815 [Aquisalinus flavus]